jgi:inward rectifier potassium channel
VARPIRFKAPGADYEVRIVGVRPTPLRDFYHALLRHSWAVTLAVIALVFVVVNGAYAALYVALGGIANARPGSYADAFFFSVQTIYTIGYGSMYPVSPAANALVVSEALVGLVLTAMATGLVFAKFSRQAARVQFSREAVVAVMNGKPTLSFRIGNERGNRIVDAQIRVSLVRTERSEGGTFYRSVDLRLARARVFSLTRSWSVLHTIDDASPLAGTTPESLVGDEAELQVLVVGLDDTSLQPIHASHQYFAGQILWGARHADVLSESEDGALVLDMRKFHDIEPTRASDDFPYSYRGLPPRVE